jgi:iron complex transport system ATP-binding protein
MSVTKGRRTVDVPRLDLRGVTYAMNGKKILDTVSWVVEGGEHWAVLGPNGAGKTTLLRIVCGYLWPNEGGEVYRNGETLVNLCELRRSIGWVTSDLVERIPGRQRVLDTVVSGKYAQIGLTGYPWERPTESDFQRAERHLEELGCEELTGRSFGTLSQGEQQKVLISRARMTDPYLIILDEPCAGMDPGAREVFLSSLLPLGRNGKGSSLVYVTHHVEEILPVFNRTLLLKEGKAILSGETKEILTPPNMKRLYGISVQLIRKNGRYWPVPE